MKLFAPASRLVLATMLACSINAHAADTWSTTDKVLAGAFLSSLTADYLQTRQIAREPDRWYEQGNPLLGDQPSASRVNIIFLTSAVVTLGVAHILPSKWRKVLLVSGTVIEAGFAAHNARIGLKVGF